MEDDKRSKAPRGSHDAVGKAAGGTAELPESERTSMVRQERFADPIGMANDGRLFTYEASSWLDLAVPSGRSFVKTVARRTKRNHAAGTLYGLAVGDALGTTLEFEPLEAPRFPHLTTGPHTSITGGGPFSVAPGQVTDDTQMACTLFRTILEEGEFCAEDVAPRYVRWRASAFDIGGQTSAALAKIAGGCEPAAAGLQVWEESGRNAAGNGSLMRTAPIAVFLAWHGDYRRSAFVDDSAITH